MPKKEKPTAKEAAVIEIGSNELRLRIAQNVRGKMKFLESATYPLSLGSDAFTGGKISFEKVDAACTIIKNFMEIARSYGIEECEVVATTAIRESKNRDYILDQIKIKTGVEAQVIDGAQEKLFIYKLMAQVTPAEHMQSGLMLYTGSGSVGIAVWENNKVTFTDNIQIGSMRISELFGNMQEYTATFYVLVEDYLESYIHFIEADIPEGTRNFVASGQEISMIAELTNAEKDHELLRIHRDKLFELFEELKFKTVDKICEDYGLPIEKAEVLLPAVCIYKKLIGFTQAEEIISPMVLLSDALLYKNMFPQHYSRISKEFDKSTILCARAIAHKFNDVTAHHTAVEKYALQIFDKIRKIHGMGKREKLLLQTAAILHDIGKFINVKDHHIHVYNIVTGLEIIGINHSEKEIIALLCLFHSRLSPYNDYKVYMMLPTEKQVLVSKLSAMLKIADSLDTSHEQKFTDIDVKLTEKELVITISTDKNIELEIWSFKEKRALFEEVFGIKAVIKRKRTV